MKSDRMEHQIDALEFAQLELVLYLDVHPMDETARALWEQNAKQLEQLEQQYTMETGKVWPMRQNHNAGMPAWVEEPWPWEYQ